MTLKFHVSGAFVNWLGNFIAWPGAPMQMWRDCGVSLQKCGKNCHLRPSSAEACPLRGLLLLLLLLHGECLTAKPCADLQGDLHSREQEHEQEHEQEA